MLPQLGPLELGLILLIVILVFGAGKLPELGGAVGKTLREFRQATKDIDDVKETVRESVSLEPNSRKEVKVKSESTEKKVAGSLHPRQGPSRHARGPAQTRLEPTLARSRVFSIGQSLATRQLA